MLSVCGGLVLSNPPYPEGSLLSRSNWFVATALPSRADFPPNFDYSLSGTLGRAKPPASSAEDHAEAIPRPAEYTPDGCGDIPQLLASPGTHVASVRVYRDPEPWWIARAEPPDAAATGEIDVPGPTARFEILAVGDGRDLITKYLRWLRRCRTYDVATADPLTDPLSAQTHERTVTTTLNRRPVGPADAALAVTRSFTPVDDPHRSPATYYVSYYAVRGLLLECTTNMTDSDVGLMKKVAAQTLRRLHAL